MMGLVGCSCTILLVYHDDEGEDDNDHGAIALLAQRRRQDPLLLHAPLCKGDGWMDGLGGTMMRLDCYLGDVMEGYGYLLLFDSCAMQFL